MNASFEPLTQGNELSSLLDRCGASIQQAYQELGHTMGWRFLTCPRASLSGANDVALITLNPGGNETDAAQSGLSYESGSAYVDEAWRNALAGHAPLQRQVQALFRELMNARGDAGTAADFLRRRVLTAHFVPFRSPSIAALHNAPRSIHFARDLWADVLREWLPSLIVTIDAQAFDNISDILLRSLGGSPIDANRFTTGWGTFTADGRRIAVPGRTGAVTLIRLPHLSRFALFAEPGYTQQRRGHLERLFNWMVDSPHGTTHPPTAGPGRIACQVSRNISPQAT